MKKSIFILMSGLLIVAALLAFNLPGEKSTDTFTQEETAMFPENIDQIFETSCNDCHGESGSNAKAKTKLNFGKWEDMSAAKKVGKMEGIVEVVKSGDMPPKKYVEKNPGAALSQEQIEAVVQWASDETAKLMGEGK
jgi:mono/diheme cytochrome c family protein